MSIRKSIILKAICNENALDSPDFLLIELTSSKASRLLVQRECLDSIHDPAFRSLTFHDEQAHWFRTYDALDRAIQEGELVFTTSGLCIAPPCWVPQMVGETCHPTEVRTGGSYVELRKDLDPIWVTCGPMTGERVASVCMPWELIVAIAAGLELP